MGAATGVMTFARYGNAPYTSASPVFNPNATATTNNASVFSPDNVSKNSWYAVAYSGTGTANPDSNVTYSIYYDLSGVNGIASVDSLYLMKRNSYSSPWVALSTSVIGTALTAGPVYGFGDFSIGSMSTVNPLPVKWLNVSGQRLDALNNKISWTTASELNTSHFVVERSMDGKPLMTWEV
jgi:hypothetical protein